MNIEELQESEKIKSLVRRMQTAPDFGYDDEEMELTRILSTYKLVWKWGNNHKITFHIEHKEKECFSGEHRNDIATHGHCLECSRTK